MSDAMKRRDRAEVAREWAQKNIEEIRRSLIGSRHRPIDMTVFLDLVDLLFPEDQP